MNCAEAAMPPIAPFRAAWRTRLRPAAGLALALLALLVAPARAEEMPVFQVHMKDGAIVPDRLTVPAGRPFKIEIHNEGTTPAEFESVALHKEKVLSAGASSSLVFRHLEPGSYDVFDDFHPSAKAVLVAQ
jgi:Cupredoxin-like domain